MASKQLKRRLTAKQRFWLAHSQACASQGDAMSVYAAKHRLSLKQFYNWKWRLGRLNLLDTFESNSPALTFQAVEIVDSADSAPTTSNYRIGFPNGLWVDVAGAVEYTGMQQLLTLLKALQ